MKKIKEENIYIYGKNAISEALASNPGCLKRIFIHQDIDNEFRDLIIKSKVPYEFKIGARLPKDIEDEVHQGVIGVISANKLLKSYEDFFNELNVNDNTAVVILGELQDPQNVGAIIRSAAAFGISAVLIPVHNQAQITGAVVKVSAGMVFKMPIVQIGNVNNVIRDLKEKGFWAYGLAGEGTQSLTEEKFDAPTIFVIGSEGKGIKEKTREACDILLKIPIDEKCESLNAATAAGVAFYAWSAKHLSVLK